MGECTEKRYAELLAAYEMGLLKGEELQKFERHLLVCNHCFEEVSQFHAVNRHIVNSPAIRDIVLGPAAPVERPKRSRRRKFWSAAIPISIAVLLFLIFQPWNIEFKPTKEAVAEENRLLVLCFENLTEGGEQDRLGEIVCNLLMTDIAESHYVQVISDHKLSAVMKSLGVSNGCEMDQAIILEVADKTGADWVLTGTIIRQGNRTGLTSELINTTTGSIESTQQVIGEETDDIFSLVDRLTIEVKKDIALPPAAFAEPDQMIANIITDSPEAYRHFLDGMKYVNMIYVDRAIDAFETAVKYDSTFAMAYYQLARLKNPEYIEQAIAYSDNVSWREKHYIKSLQAHLQGQFEVATRELRKIIGRYPDEVNAYYQLGVLYYYSQDYRKAIEYHAEAVQIDPFYKLAYNQLASCYNRLGDFEKAIIYINKYIELAPDEANPYDSRGKIYADFGRLDDAIASYETALEKNPDFPESLRRLGVLYSFRREFHKADSVFEYVISLSGFNRRIWVRLYQAVLLTRQGRIDSALTIIDKLISLGEIEKASAEFMVQAYLGRALAYRAQRLQGREIAEIKKAIDIHGATSPDPSMESRHLYVQFLAENGRYDQADEMLSELKSYADSDQNGIFYYWYARGGLRFARGDYQQAVRSFARALEERKSFERYGHFEARHMLARAYLKMGRIEEAVEEFEKLSVPYSYHRAYWSIWDVLSHYYLGIAYEESRWHKRAALEFKTFLDFWKDADPGIAEVEDARERLSRLEKYP